MKYEKSTENANGPCSTKSSGPGAMPCTSRAPMRMAVIGSPGIPSVIMGMSAPPAMELFADSGAATPSTQPLPNCSGSLLAFWA